MDFEDLTLQAHTGLQQAVLALSSLHTYVQLAVVFAVYIFAFVIAKKIKSSNRFLLNEPAANAHPVVRFVYRASNLVYPLIALMLLLSANIFSTFFAFSPWLLNTAFAIAALLFFNALINTFVVSLSAAKIFRWVGLPIIFLKLVGLLPSLINALESVSLTLGNIEVSLYGVVRVVIFGGFLFWLGRASNNFGKAVIKRQESLDVPTREVFSKLLEVTVFCVIALILLNIMGINLTTLAVFSGALGVGVGLGLQAIASNFISGIIILLDKSLTVGDYVELADGKTGFVREFRMRYTVIETYDGKDILVPNEKFISDFLINWTHKDPKQRYEVQFSVAYNTDIRSMVDIIKAVVAKHPQVISGPDYNIEEQPDCEIESFGESGVNILVEFWMDGVDDGKNRVGGDLLLTIFETLREHNIAIPFPQREVRVLDKQAEVKAP